MPARIGIDALTALAHAPGAGRYARELIRALAPLCAPGELVLYEVGSAQRVLPRSSLGAGVQLPSRASRRPRRLNAWVPWWRHADRELGGVRIFHQTAPVPLPLAEALPTRAFAELPDPAQAHELRGLAAAFVFSRAVQAGLVGSGVLPPERVHLVPVGCEHWARELPLPLPSPTRPRIGMLGRERPLERRPLWREFASARGWEWLELGPGTPESELPRAVAGCSAILHLTDAIGTPVTALECMRLGVPIVTREAEVFRSALGSAGLWADPRDPPSVAHALTRALARRSDPLWQEQARRQSEPWTWSACARAHLEVWRQL